MAEPKVMVIPARRQVGNNINIDEQPKLRVAAYCRVSTDSDEQAPAMMHKLNITRITSIIIPNGISPEYLRMMVSLAPILKSVRNLTS